MPNRYDDRDERHRGEFSAGPFGGRADGSLGGDYARDRHRGGYGDDYARDGGFSGGGGHDDYTREDWTPQRWGGSGAPADLGGRAAAYGGDPASRLLRKMGFRGRGPKNWRRSDERIREEVNERLTHHDGVDATDVDVTVETGEVTLSGHVGSRWEKRIAEDIAESVHGVHDVHNRLAITDRQTHLGKASE
ncbi:MAG TPA: BON domain-containing protein [Thermoanaerobaculia bacterium]